MPTQIQFDLEITLQSAWHVGTGMSRGLLNRTTQRNARGQVYLPASTIKGRLRNACEQIARLYIPTNEVEKNRILNCHPPEAQKMCRGKNPCLVCRLFGSAYQGEQLYFEDGLLREDISAIYDSTIQAQPRTRTQINRQRGIVNDGHLFTSEYAEKALIFQTQVTGYLPLTQPFPDEPLAYELILLVAGVRLVNALGGDKSAGFGNCSMNFIGDLHVGAAPISTHDLIDDWLEELKNYDGGAQ